MSGVHRLLTRKDKKPSKAAQATIEYGELGSVFVPEPQPPKKKADKEEEKKVKAIQAKLQQYGITKITTTNIEYALRLASCDGSADEALRLCLLLEDTYEGLLKAYNPSTKLLGAVNREGVTCYLDALLFAMFARLDGFEAMLYNSLEDAPRKKLAGLLRLWVNLLRTGRLITTDVTMNVQAALAECGWEAANRLEQQDTSEAFTFITGQLELPLLTLKMDLYHTGKEDPNDDHKFVNERLLEVAILERPVEGKSAVTLEDCLEHYFNNRVEVKRHLERQRRQSVKRNDELDRQVTNDSLERQDTQDKLPDLHIETIEIADYAADSPTTPAPATPATEITKKGPVEQLRPSMGRTRADSIFSQRKVKVTEPEKIMEDSGSVSSVQTRKTKASTRTEVLMPAWQFFKLLPWYTDNMPTSDLQVAAHFATKRPILGICLKRYMVNNSGDCSRLDTFVDIPLEIAVPDFVSDDSMEEGSPLVGNFKLVLQSVVCHRGKSLHSGHYIALVRGSASNAVNGMASPSERPTSSTSSRNDDSWMLFDDLASERVRYVDISKALKDECPYLLFYQVQPIDEDEPLMSGPPSYDEAISRANSEQMDLMDEKVVLPGYSDSDLVLVEKQVAAAPNGTPFETSDTKDYLTATEPPSRTSMDVESRARLSMSSDRRRSIAFEGDRASTVFSVSGPPTPSEEGRLGFLNLPSRRGSKQISKKSKSRPTSVGAEGSTRFSLNMSRLTTRMSKSELPPVFSATGNPPVQVEDQLQTATERLEQEAQKAEKGAGENGTNSSSNNNNRNSGVSVANSTELPKKKKGKERDDGDHDKADKRKRKKGEVPDRDCNVM
ncbi:hypothetical protein CAC42_5065 [Sphaceloma murrayae]|uniref:ubiquitinyl hydrolase 1 n=1 Tax=Sphaceloma murrayae TaxID=2082308 RepID=A0A2K1QTY2_9PEZI|nr:hypothetical protein CAC42_5065 [Sphaceloma murrayae]